VSKALDTVIVEQLLKSVDAPPAIIYSRIFLDESSMWAMGANALTIPPRRKNAPLVTWNHAAIDRVRAAWTDVQVNATCNRSLLVFPSHWGITSQMRDIGDAAMISLAFNRPLVYIVEGKRPRWSRKDAWLGCFFEGFDTPRCPRLREEEDDGRRRAVWKFQPNMSTPDLREETHRRLSSAQSLILSYLSELTFVLDDPGFFPQNVYEGLIRDKLVRIVDKDDSPVEPASLKSEHPSLYHTIAVSALHTMLMPIAFPPQTHVVQKAITKSRRFMSPKQRPCVALHVRLTDKQTDGGITREIQYGVDYVLPALERIAHTTKRNITAFCC
jgi:hypothetical protein